MPSTAKMVNEPKKLIKLPTAKNVEGAFKYRANHNKLTNRRVFRTRRKRFVPRRNDLRLRLARNAHKQKVAMRSYPIHAPGHKATLPIRVASHKNWREQLKSTLVVRMPKQQSNNFTPSPDSSPIISGFNDLKIDHHKAVHVVQEAVCAEKQRNHVFICCSKIAADALTNLLGKFEVLNAENSNGNDQIKILFITENVELTNTNRVLIETCSKGFFFITCDFSSHEKLKIQLVTQVLRHKAQITIFQFRDAYTGFKTGPTFEAIKDRIEKVNDLQAVVKKIRTISKTK